MKGGVPGKFQYAALPSELTLPAHTSYYLVTEESYGKDLWHDYYNTLATPTSAAVIDGPVYGGWTPLAVPNRMYAPVDFRYSPLSSTPVFPGR